MPKQGTPQLPSTPSTLGPDHLGYSNTKLSQWIGGLLLSILCCCLAPASLALDDLDSTLLDSALNDQTPGTTQTNNGLGISVKNTFLPVEEAYRLNADLSSTEGGSQLRLNWQIAEGYYLYRHAFQFALQDAEGQAIEIDARIPKGKEKQDEYFGLVQVYYQSLDVDIALAAQQAAAEQHAMLLTVTSQGCADEGLCYPPRTQYFQIDTQQMTVLETDQATYSTTPSDSVSTAQTTTGSTSDSAAPPPANNRGLITMLLFALAGGAILNLMPCVFPVLSLKVLAFANDKGHSPVLHGLTYSLGVIVSFVAVAALLVSLKSAGSAIGWGFHLQSPWFVAALCYLFFIMGLSLSGYVELGASWMNVGGRLASQSGYSGSFFTGILATVVASPCTAPLMGTALGFAVTQTTPIALLIFAALGAGMALPLLILSCSPALLKHIPKPGPWMDVLKQLLAFPLYFTAIWLCWVVGNQTGANGMAALLVGCVLWVMTLWLWRGATLRRCLAALCAAGALAILSSSMLEPNTAVSGAAKAPVDAEWQAYTPERLQTLRAEGKPVFVNITADWCITCLTNEKVTLSQNAVKEALRAGGYTYLKGDWTNYDADITALLEHYDRTGIPLYLVYPEGSAERAQVLPQILTVGIVTEALAANLANP